MIHGIHSPLGASAGNETLQIVTRKEAPNVFLKNEQAENQVERVEHGQSIEKGLADLDKDQGNYLDIVVDDNIRQTSIRLPDDLENTLAKNQMQITNQGQGTGEFLSTQIEGNTLNVLA